MKRIRIALGGSGTEHHIQTIIQTVKDFDVEGQFEIFHLPDRKSFYSHLSDFDIYHELFGYHATARFMINKLLGKKNICHWIGSDVLRAQENPKVIRRTKWTAKFVDLHLADFYNLIEELKQINIHAVVWIPPVRNIHTLPVYPIPDAFTVLAYLPDDHHQFYGSDIIYRLARELPDIKFMILAGTAEKQYNLPNLNYLGWVHNMESVYKQTSVLIRATQHDGFARMVGEALAHGINVIFKAYPRPHCHHATNYDEIKAVLLKLRSNLAVNEAGAKYVREICQYPKLGRQLLDIYKKLYFGEAR